MQFFDKLAEEEDDELIEILKGEYWHILFLSMGFPRWKQRRISFGLLLFYPITLALHMVMMAYALYLFILERNWEQASLTLHYLILIVLGMFLPLSLNVGRSWIADIYRTCAKDIGHYSSGRIYDEQSCVDIKKDVEIETYYYLTMPVLVGMGGAAALSGPYFSKWYSGMENPYSPNGLSMKLPVAGYYPFPTDQGVAHYVIAGTQVIVVGILALQIVVPEVVFISLTQKIMYDLRVIGYSMDSLVTRSMDLLLYTKNFQGKFSHMVIEDTQFQRTIELCFKETNIHQQTMTRFLSSYKKLTTIPLAAATIVAYLTIGISLYNVSIALKANEVGTCTTFVLLLASETIGLYVQCVLGAAITEQSEILRDKLYMIEWYNFDLKNRKLMLNYQTAITEPYVIKAGEYIDMNMDTFSSVLNSAYSFFNIMQTME